MTAGLPKEEIGPLRARRISDDHRLNSFGMSQGHTKTNRAAVVPHEQSVAIQMQLLRKVLHDLSQMTEGIGEIFVIRPG